MAHKKAITPPLKSRNIAIVVPIYNEAKNIPALLMKLNKVYQDKLCFAPETFIIDDGSTDDSVIVLKEFSQKYNFYRIIEHFKQRGLTEVLKTALRYCNNDWLLFIPGDLESDPEEDLIPIITKAGNGWDAVTGWRQSRTSKKKISSWLGNLLIRKFFDIKVHDINWIKLVRKDALDEIALLNISYRYMIPALGICGYKTTEVKTTWHPRKYGKSKFGLMELITSVYELCKFLFSLKQVKNINIKNV